MDDVLSFWFADVSRAWKKDPVFDQEIRERYGALHAALDRGEHQDWRATPRGTLAYVIVLDQFSRNMFRDSPRMFASDPRALQATKEALDRGQHQALTEEERGFLYLPLMHSEALADQARSVELYRAFASDFQHKFAVQHRDIVARFGRFPHRNALLGRDSTPEEVEFLKQPGSSF